MRKPAHQTQYSSDLLEFWALSIVRDEKKNQNTTFRKLDLFSSSGEGGKTPTLLGPVERDNDYTLVERSALQPKPL
jgi:hypothetical protein